MAERFDTIRKQIRGPVYPVLPAFTDTGALDLESVKKYTAYLCENGAKVLMVTAGTSRLNLLSTDEIAMLNKAVADSAGEKRLIIGATPPYGSTETTVALTYQAMSDGCDAMLYYYPDRYYSDGSVIDYYLNISDKTDAPFLIHGKTIENGKVGSRMPYSLELCLKLAESDHLIGMKEELENEDLRYKLAVHLNERMPLIVAGGSMRKYLGSTLYGVKSWLTGAGSFVPRIEEDFFKFTEKKDYNSALKLVANFEEPLFNVAFNMGWHIAMRAMLDILGLMPGYERQPMPEATAEQRNKLILLTKKFGWF